MLIKLQGFKISIIEPLDAILKAIPHSYPVGK
jgi:hypothetical protein